MTKLTTFTQTVAAHNPPPVAHTGKGETMNLQQQRQTAQRAARSEARRLGYDMAALDSQAALAILDDMARTEPDLVASQWHTAASDNQISLFMREWK